MSQERNIFRPTRPVCGWEQVLRCSLGQRPFPQPLQHCRQNSEARSRRKAPCGPANLLPLVLGSLWSWPSSKQAWAATQSAGAEGRPPRGLFFVRSQLLTHPQTCFRFLFITSFRPQQV